MKKNFILPAVIVFVVGFVLGHFIQLDKFPPEFLGGDVSKAKKSAVTTEGMHQEIMVQRLRADTAYYNQRVSTLSLTALYSTMIETSTQIALEAATYAEPLQEENETISGLQSLAANTTANVAVAIEAVQAAASGCDVEVEQAMNNVLVSYMVLSRGVKATQQWVSKAAQFLADNNAEDYQKLAFAIGVLADEVMLAQLPSGARLNEAMQQKMYNSLVANQHNELLQDLTSLDINLFAGDGQDVFSIQSSLKNGIEESLMLSLLVCPPFCW